MNKAPSFVFPALFATLFLVVFNYTLGLMGGEYIVSELGGSNFISTYPISSYALGNALGVPLGKALSGRVSTVKLLVQCLLLFAIASFLCSVATTFIFFVFARFFQGLVSGPFFILATQIQGALTPKEKSEKYTSFTLTMLAIVPVLGASFGGWISYEYNWRLNYVLDVPASLAIAAILYFKLRNYQPPVPISKTFDGIGYTFFAIAVLSIGFVITTGQEFDWFRSPLIVTFSVIGLVTLLFFILWNTHHPESIINLKLFKEPVFAFSIFNLAILFSAYFGMVILLALWLTLYVNYTVTYVAVLIGTMAVAGIFTKLFIEKELGKSDARVPLAIALLCLAVSSFHTTVFNDEVNFGRIAVSRVLAGFGLALFLPPLFRLSYRTFPHEKASDIVVIFQAVRSISSGLGAPLYITLWQRRQTFYHERLGEKITQFSELTRSFFEKAQFFNLEGKAADLKLLELLERKATALALDDSFYLMGWILTIDLILLGITYIFPKIFFMPERRKDLKR